MVLIDFQQSRAFGKKTVAPGQNALDTKSPIRPAHRRVVPALRLIFGNQFDHRLLHRLAPRFLRHCPINHSPAYRHGHAMARNLGQRAGTQQDDRKI